MSASSPRSSWRQRHRGPRAHARRRHGPLEEDRARRASSTASASPQFPKTTSTRSSRWVERMNADMLRAGARAARAARLRPRPRPRLAGRAARPSGWRDALRRALARDDGPRDRARPPPGLGAASTRSPTSTAIERWMVRSADRVIICSHYMRGHVADVFGIAERGITVIPNGIDPRDLAARRATSTRCARASPRPTRSSCCWSAAWSTRRASSSRSTRSPRRDRAARQRALPGRRHGHRRGRAEGPGASAWD